MNGWGMGGVDTITPPAAQRWHAANFLFLHHQVPALYSLCIRALLRPTLFPIFRSVGSLAAWAPKRPGTPSRRPRRRRHRHRQCRHCDLEKGEVGAAGGKRRDGMHIPYPAAAASS